MNDVTSQYSTLETGEQVKVWLQYVMRNGVQRWNCFFAQLLLYYDIVTLYSDYIVRVFWSFDIT